MDLSPKKRKAIVQALRDGTVPEAGLDALAVGIDHFGPVLDAELANVATGASHFKAIRGEYGSGKTFFTRHLAERASAQGFATAEVQISETDTPLHKLETVYRRAIQSLRVANQPPSAFRSVLDSWFFGLEDDAIAADPHLEEADAETLTAAVGVHLENKLRALSATAPGFAPALRGYRRALDAEDHATAESLIDWLGGQPHVAAAAKRYAGVRGDLDNDGAFGSLQGLLMVLRDAGHSGLLLVLDEVETLQRVRSDMRDKALNALRKLIDEVSEGRYPGLYLVITGTPAFYDGQQGVQRLAPLAARLATDLSTDPRFDTGRAIQLRLQGFTLERLEELGARVRDIYSADSAAPERIAERVNDAYIADFAAAVAGKLGGQAGIAPRVYLKKLVADVLDRVDQFPDFDPRNDYHLSVTPKELKIEERGVLTPDDIDLPLSDNVDDS